MSYGTHDSLHIPGLLAGADLSSSQFLFVKLASTAGEVIAVNASTDAAIGVLQNAPEDTEAAEVRFLGVSKLRMAATIDAAADLGWDSTGQGTARTQGGSRSIGRVISASTTEGDISTVLLTGYWRR